MTNNVSQNKAARCAKILGSYRVHSLHGALRAVVLTYIPGQTLEALYPGLAPSKRKAVTAKLKEALIQMRRSTQPYIGQINHTPVGNFHDQMPEFDEWFIGPFDSKEQWDEWCLERVRKRHGEKVYSKWKKKLQKMDEEDGPDAGKFVLTHGNLVPANIIVRDGEIVAILDWECSGFYPPYIERVSLVAGFMKREKWWMDVVKEILPCRKDPVKFHELVMDRGY